MKRTEYPRPQFVREEWLNLNGEWQFTFDDDDQGIKGGYHLDNTAYDQKINVPFVYQSVESGINDRTPHDRVWYQREFELTKVPDKRVLLHFGAVDYCAQVFIDGQQVGSHAGGHTSFSFDITDYLTDDQRHQITVRAEDRHDDESIPRGKQFWEAESAGIWYTNSTGIWQTVWLEVLSPVYLEDVKITPLFDAGKVQFEVMVSQLQPGLHLDCEISFKGTPVTTTRVNFTEKQVVFDCELYQNHIFRTNYHHEGWSWTPETPNLFDVHFTLAHEEVYDQVTSYFGMRKVHQENGMLYLNNKPYYQKLVLDQGYWPTGLLTAPTDEAFIKDIELAKEMGFNGCRKHQKTEDPRFLYWADKLGYLVWGECAAPAVYTTDAVIRLMKEWAEIVSRDYNHPAIITWVPINESWGVPKISFDRQQQHFSQTMYHYLHSIDTTRMVISNDGWAMTETDICALHNYNHGNPSEKEKYLYFKESLSTRELLVQRRSTPWPVFAGDFQYQGQPILLTEFGGIGFDVSGQPGWGYTSVENETEFVEEYRRVMAAVYASKGLWGYCYTQITDVEQEINGLLTYDRQPKCQLSLIRAINDGYHVPQVE